MRIPKLSELFGGMNLGTLMKRLFQRPAVQLGQTLKRGEEAVGPGRYLRRILGGSEPSATKLRPRTATPDAEAVFRALTSQRRQLAELSSPKTKSPANPPTATQPRNRPTIIQRAGNVYQTIRNVLGGQSRAADSSAPGSAPSMTPGAHPQPPVQGPQSPIQPARPSTPATASGQPPVSQSIGLTTPMIQHPETFHAGSPPLTPTTATPPAAELSPWPPSAKPDRQTKVGGAMSSAKSFVTNLVQSIAGSRERGTAGSPGSASARATSSAGPVTPTTATPDAREARQSMALSATQRAKAEAEKRSAKSARLDKLQRFGDVAGVLDPSGIVDGINALVSIKRAKDEPDRRAEHLKNAAISGVSMLPYLGDLAKLTKVGKAEKATTAGAKATGKTGVAAQPAKSGGSFVSQILTGAQNLAPLALQGAQAVFADHDKSMAAKTNEKVKSATPGPRPSILGAAIQKVASPVIGGIASLFGGRKGATADAARPATGARPQASPGAATPSSPQPQSSPWWRQPDNPADAPIPTPQGKFEYVWKRELREWWQSKTGRRKGRGAAGAAQRPGREDRPNAPESQPPIGAPGESPSSPPPPRSFGQRVRSAVGGLGTAIAASVAPRERPIDPVTSEEALRHGSSFGDVMGGKKKLEDVEKEIEGNRRLAESKTRFGDAVKNATGKLGGMALMAVGLTKALQTLNAATLARQRELAYVNANIAIAGGQADVAKIMRDIEMGRRTSGTMAGLSKESQDFEKAILPYAAAATNLGNRILALGTKMTNFLFEIATHIPLISAAAKAAASSLEEEDREAVMPWVKLMDDAAKARAPKAARRV